MDMNVVDHGSGPGVKERKNANFYPHKMRVESKLHQGIGGSFHEDWVEQFLVGAHNFAQFFGEGKNQMKIGDRQKLLAFFLKPFYSLRCAALGTGTIATGMVGEMQRRAVVALIHMAPQRFGSAIHDVLQGTVVGWKHALGEPIKVGGTVVPENIRQP